MLPTGDIYSVHFRDACLWSNALLVHDQVSKIRSLADEVRIHGLLDLDDFDAFTQCSINADLFGFPYEVDPPSFTGLHELLGENWIGERVLDARAYQITESVKSCHDCPTLLILSSHFHTRLSNAFNSNQLCKGLKEIRESLLTDLPDVLAFVFNKKNSHWAVCIVSMKTRIVQQGDSLGWTQDDSMLAKLQWFLQDVTEAQGVWSEKPLVVPNQGSDSGSCGVIALSIIHSFIDPAISPWCPEKASSFRRQWLQALIQHHLAAIRSQDEVCT
jgi:Ulp1 family protease